MSQKKKTHTHPKVEAAQHRNEFLQRFKLFCDKVADTSIFHLIPPDKLEELYVFRNRPIRLEAAAGQNIHPAMLKEAKGLLSILKNRYMQLGVGSVNQLSLYDFTTIGMTLMLYALRVKESDYPNATLVKLKLSPLAAFANSQNYHAAWADIHNIENLIAVVSHDLTAHLYLIKQENRGEINGTTGMYTCLDVYQMQTEKISIIIDGFNRPVYRVAMPVDENLPLDCVSINAKLLNLKQETALPVYVQAHALNRLSERMDGVTKGFLHLYIYVSLKNPEIYRNKKGEWLFEFKLLNHKVGYFVADIIDQKIILRTFLFITNNGTPEGDKLLEHTGFLKEDKQYLAIDKFSSFMHSDIKNNERIKSIFINAGCQSLFEIDPSVCLLKGANQTLAALIENYLLK